MTSNDRIKAAQERSRRQQEATIREREVVENAIAQVVGRDEAIGFREIADSADGDRSYAEKTNTAETTTQPQPFRQTQEGAGQIGGADVPLDEQNSNDGPTEAQLKDEIRAYLHFGNCQGYLFGQVFNCGEELSLGWVLAWTTVLQGVTEDDQTFTSCAAYVRIGGTTQQVTTIAAIGGGTVGGAAEIQIKGLHLLTKNSALLEVLAIDDVANIDYLRRYIVRPGNIELLSSYSRSFFVPWTFDNNSDANGSYWYSPDIATQTSLSILPTHYQRNYTRPDPTNPNPPFVAPEPGTAWKAIAPSGESVISERLYTWAAQLDDEQIGILLADSNPAIAAYGNQIRTNYDSKVSAPIGTSARINTLPEPNGISDTTLLSPFTAGNAEFNPLVPLAYQGVSVVVEVHELLEAIPANLLDPGGSLPKSTFYQAIGLSRRKGMVVVQLGDESISTSQQPFTLPSGGVVFGAYQTNAMVLKVGVVR